MEWMFRLKAKPGQRLVMRIAQIFDQQLLTLRRLTLEDAGDGPAIEIVVDCSVSMAGRLEAKLWHLGDVTSVHCSGCEEASPCEAGPRGVKAV